MNSPWPGVATQIYIVPATSSAAETVNTVSSGEQLAGLQVGNTLFHSTRKTNRNFWTDVTLIKKHPGNIWVPHWNMSFVAGPNITDHCPAHNSIRFKHHRIKNCLRCLSVSHVPCSKSHVKCITVGAIFFENPFEGIKQLCHFPNVGCQLQLQLSQPFLHQFWKFLCPSSRGDPDDSKTPPEVWLMMIGWENSKKRSGAQNWISKQF